MPMANTSASVGCTTPVTRGRCWVRCITLSMSRSTYMLMALAPPAASVPPRTVATIRLSGGMPRAATTMVGTVVTRRSSMIRGLVSAMNPPTRTMGLTGRVDDIGATLGPPRPRRTKHRFDLTFP